MLRSLFFSRPCLPSIPASVNAQQIRFNSKMFVRKKNKKGKTYYVLNKEGALKARKPLDKELFVFNDLVLDLDAEDCKTVRGFIDEDDSIMAKRWKPEPIRQQAQSWVDHLENDVNQSRHKIFEFTNRPVSPWKIRKHDILSLALRGIPLPEIENNTRDAPDSAISFNSDHLDIRLHYQNVRTMLSENIIPLDAVETDVNLLNWLRLRYATMESQERRNEKSPSPAQIMAEVARQTTIKGIRKVIKRSLASSCDASIFDTHSGQLLRACDLILEHSDSRQSDQLEMLKIYASLKEHFSSTGASLEAHQSLCNRGLSLSAVCFKPEVTIEYLRLGFLHSVWSASPGLDTILGTLTTYGTLLRQNKSATQPMFQQQTLLQALTGALEEEEGCSHESFRTIILSGLQGHLAAESRYVLQLYHHYLQLLSDLGAFATLWKEWRRFHSIVQERFKKKKDLIEATEAMFAKIIMDADISVIGQYDQTALKDLDFAQCVTLDYHAMESRVDQGSNKQKDPRSDDELPIGISHDTLKALELPLGAWLKEITRAASSRNDFPS